jgi:hypothetical protein
MNHICPLCGGENDCAAESAEAELDCWCFRASIPAELLKRVPEPFLGVSCICRHCVEQFQKAPDPESSNET